MSVIQFCVLLDTEKAKKSKAEDAITANNDNFVRNSDDWWWVGFRFKLIVVWWMPFFEKCINSQDEMIADVVE